jgi:hypothetical protein
VRQQFVFSAIVGSAIGAVVSVSNALVLVLSDHLNAPRAVDEISFSLAVNGVVITALAIFGCLEVLTIWTLTIQGWQ